jgi:microcystin-dependent protein
VSAFSFVQYPISTTTVGPFSVSFPYIAAYQVEVRKNGTLLVSGTDYTWPTSSTVQLVANAVNGDLIEVRRNTLKKADGTIGRLVDWSNSAKITESNLDKADLQCFYLAQEAFDAAANAMQLASDGTYDATTKRIKNVVNPLNAQDAATKQYVDLTLLGASPATPLAIASGGTGQATKQAAFNALSPSTTKGDLNVHNGTNVVRKAAGTNKQVLTADSSQTDGLKWDDSGTQVGTVVWVTGSAASAGTVKLNGALLSRTTFADLWAYAQASGNIAASDALWTSNSLYGQYSPGDGSTTFRVPDLRGYFVRAFDDARGVDSGRTIGSSQADDLKPHTHTGTTGGVSAGHTHQGPNPGPYNQASGRQVVTGAGIFADLPSTDGTTPPNTGGQSNDHTHSFTTASTGTTESRPKNVALLACVKY